ncbi:hypothetical protein E3T40_13265 [Cryobacterium sp. TMT1-19]|uniref:hypothetical protein n=1 Tax=Cryobacterium sp. TMT1-19 TaxID=1259231 RepID=UPI00106A16F8|nr:hypothetical protein [Cryobacterium sp. TMT1-19]TFD32031.1 hypothetical protein E3T40_13265 [Cryobacterium sp. TMT1-19]
MSNDEPDLLDGHTIDELSDYLDRGKMPTDPSIDTSTACQMAMASPKRLRGAMSTLLRDEAEEQPARDDNWVTAILDRIVLDVRSGRDIPISHPSPNPQLFVTEGAVRGLVRAASDTVDNLIVGRCRLDGDLTALGAPITVTVDASVYKGENIPALADKLRDTLVGALRTHTELAIAGIDVIIRDIYLIKPEHGEEEATP